LRDVPKGDEAGRVSHMPSATYSFIDIAVLDDVRRRFAAGDALAILSTDLDEVIWANGPGAAVFGYPDIEAIIGAATRLPQIARRQIMATAGYPEIGRDRGVIVRLATGISSRAVPFLASSITLPHGERAVLLAVPASRTASHRPGEIAERAIGGLNEPGHFAALVDASGAVAAASDGFAELGVAAHTLAALVSEVRDEADRLVKRFISGKGGRLPAGIARLTDEPALHLLIVVDDVHTDTIVEPAAMEGLPAPMEEIAAETSKTAPANDSAVEQTNAPDTLPGERSLAPVRFAWRTDADGKFSAISPEFAGAVGAPAADIVGRRFRDVAMIFGFDPTGEIAGLLERRDTWSGRSVLWPVAGTDLRIPVDLAALPVYGRERNFEGFRGFGVARGGDAVNDPEAVGLALSFDPAAEENSTEAASMQEEAVGVCRSEEDAGQQPGEPSEGEVRAPAVVPVPERPRAEKVIRLAEHRAPVNEKGLTAVERNAFREIGDRLKREDKPADEVGTFAATTATVTTGAGIEAPDANAARQESAAPGADAGSLPDREPDQPDAPAPQLGLSPEGLLDFSDEILQKNNSLEREDDSAEDDVAPEAAPARLQEDRPQEQRPAEEIDAVPDAAETEIAPAASLPDAGQGTRAQGEQLVPALPRTGFLPSAFSTNAAGTRDSARVDTSILARLPIPLLVHSGDNLHYANQEFLKLTGYRSIEELASAGGLDTLFGEPYEGEETGQAGGSKMRLLTQGGEEFPVEAHLQSVPWNGGKALLLALRKSSLGSAPAEASPDLRAETTGTSVHTAELQARAAEMRAIVDTATDGVVVIAEDGTIRSISRPAEALFGFDNDAVVGKPFASLFAIESQRAAQDYLSGLTEHGVASVLNDGREVIGREAQGRFIPLFMTIGRLPGDGGYCAVVRDITQWKRAEEELTQARAKAERTSVQKTDFLARVSHEIRTPLNAIIGFSELMIDEKFGSIGNDRYRDYLRDINRSGNHVLDLVNDLLDISKIEAGQQDLSYEAVSLNDALAETVAMMQPQANRERVIIRSSFASRLPDVVADLRSVRQIALNLLANAVRYTQAGGQVIVSTAYEPSGDIVMRVRDTGIGMSQAEIEQALKPFKQINALKRPRGDGTGLGLPLTKAMVEANRARFSILSTPGEGTLVEITFPSTRVLAD
jgi:PAS domain S-box-containing protein